MVATAEVTVTMSTIMTLHKQCQESSSYIAMRIAIAMRNNRMHKKELFNITVPNTKIDSNEFARMKSTWAGICMHVHTCIYSHMRIHGLGYAQESVVTCYGVFLFTRRS